MSRMMLAEMDRTLDRAVERWAKALVLEIDGKRRRLTGEEVRIAVQGHKAVPATSAAARSRIGPRRPVTRAARRIG